MSADLTRYFMWAGIVVAGALLAVVDRRQLKFPVLGVLLAAGIVAGFVIEQLSPFSFGAGSYYMDGVLLSAGSALALIGYVFAVVWAVVWQFARRRSGAGRPS